MSMKHRYFSVALVFLLVFPVTLVATGVEDAQREADLALSLTPNIENGKELYKICVVCHTPEGWGSNSGHYPQVAGQIPAVLIKQLADIRARNRDNPTMYPFSMPSSLGGAQEMADVAAYITTLPMSPANGKGPGYDLALGERIYKTECAECHGNQGEGDLKEQIPMVHGQHYRYLKRQFNWIRIGKRRNVDEKMVKQIQRFTGREISAMMDYISRLHPPQEKVAKVGWQNPDFPRYSRHTLPMQLRRAGSMVPPRPPKRPEPPERPSWAR